VSHWLDVNLLLACAWRSHRDHAAARQWLSRQRSFTTCPIAQLGFLRVSMSPAYRASCADAQAALAGITTLSQARFIPDDLPANKLPPLDSHADVTDAHLVALARAHSLKLATLDNALCQKPWANGVAENPL
jgi:toxin-antitoxin system PIN domain toxin